MIHKTNAVRLLDQMGIHYELREFQWFPGVDPQREAVWNERLFITVRYGYPAFRNTGEGFGACVPIMGHFSAAKVLRCGPIMKVGCCGSSGRGWSGRTVA